MAADKGKTIIFKVEYFVQLSLDAHAKQMNVSRSEYCRIAVREKLERAREERQQQKQDSELQVIMSMLNTMNNHLHTLMESTDNSKLHNLMMGGFRRLSQGFAITNKDRPQELAMLKTIFPAKVWEELTKMGIK